MKDELKTTIKAVWDEVKMPVIVVGTAVGGYVVGYKYAAFLTDLGIDILNKGGVIKFFDPETGLEVHGDEALKVIKNFNKKI